MSLHELLADNCQLCHRMHTTNCACFGQFVLEHAHSGFVSIFQPKNDTTRGHLSYAQLNALTLLLLPLLKLASCQVTATGRKPSHHELQSLGAQSCWIPVPTPVCCWHRHRHRHRCRPTASSHSASPGSSTLSAFAMGSAMHALWRESVVLVVAACTRGNSNDMSKQVMLCQLRICGGRVAFTSSKELPGPFAA